MTNTKEPSNASRKVASKLAADAPIWKAIDDAHRHSMPDAEDALARIVELVMDANCEVLADGMIASADDSEDFTIISVEPVTERGSDIPSHYQVTARLWGPIPGRENLNLIDDARKTWNGALTTWLGFQSGDHLTCTGWDHPDQWVDASADRLLGTAASVELGERILAAAEVR